MAQAGWVEELRKTLERCDSEGMDEVEFTFARRNLWRAAEAQRGMAHQLADDHGYSTLRKRFEGETMVWTFTR